MNTPKTQKEMLLLMSLQMDTLNKSNKELAEKQLQMSADWSIYMNKTELQMSKILGYLESDSHTNQKGVVEQLKINTNNIDTIQKNISIDKAKAGVWGVVGSGILYGIAKIFF